MAAATATLMAFLYRTDSDTMLLNKWRSYVGWTNRDIVNSPSSQIGMRLKASQGSITFIMIQSGRRIGYELFDSKTKKRLFGVRFDGSQVWIIDRQGKKRSASRNVAAHFVTESLIFSNSIAELNATLKERGNDEETWTVRPLLIRICRYYAQLQYGLVQSHIARGRRCHYSLCSNYGNSNKRTAKILRWMAAR